MPAHPPSEHRRFILTLSEFQNAMPSIFCATEALKEIETNHYFHTSDQILSSQTTSKDVKPVQLIDVQVDMEVNLLRPRLREFCSWRRNF